MESKLKTYFMILNHINDMKHNQKSQAPDVIYCSHNDKNINPLPNNTKGTHRRNLGFNLFKTVASAGIFT